MPGTRPQADATVVRECAARIRPAAVALLAAAAASAAEPITPLAPVQPGMR
jgi:hypothetical protein